MKNLGEFINTCEENEFIFSNERKKEIFSNLRNLLSTFSEEDLNLIDKKEWHELLKTIIPHLQIKEREKDTEYIEGNNQLPAVTLMNNFKIMLDAQIITLKVEKIIKNNESVSDKLTEIMPEAYQKMNKFATLLGKDNFDKGFQEFVAKTAIINKSN